MNTHLLKKIYSKNIKNGNKNLIYKNKYLTF